MKKLTQKLRDLRQHPQPLKPTSTIPLSSRFTEETFYRYRKQRGVNLGSWFVLERWITDDPFRFSHEPGQSDLDVARGSHARETLEAHWDNWITKNDWAWLAQHGINSVRIPIGYYHLCGVDPSVLHNTDFRDLEIVFSGAWTRIIQAIETAHEFDIGVLIDLHAAPGKQNNDSHSGTSLPPSFFSSRFNREHAIKALGVLLAALKTHNPPLTNIIGIELLNEPHPPSDEALKEWYQTAITKLRKIDREMPLVLGECWRPDTYADFIANLRVRSAPESTPPPGPLLLDHHLYRCFTAADISTPASAHAGALLDPNAPTPLAFARVASTLERVGSGMIVGEWSGALNPASRRGGEGEVAEYVRAQLGLYERWCAGWYWWTYKKKCGDGWGRDTGWSFRDAVEGGVFPAWVGLTRQVGVVTDVERRTRHRKEAGERALSQHTQYWSRYPGKYEHWRFEEGFGVGWDAAYLFLENKLENGRVEDKTGRVSELGLRGAWAVRHTQDHGKSYWEFEHGCFQGVEAATRDFDSGCRP